MEITRYQTRNERRYWHYLGAANLAFAALWYWLFFG
jgi:hypothetical protein